jgi:hypothetical protein
VTPIAFPQEVPSVQIDPAMRIRWISETNKSYQQQKSYDLTNWSNFGAARSGNGAPLEFFDSVDDSKAFYRVIAR